MTRATDAYDGRMVDGAEARALEAAAFAFVNRQLESAAGHRERVRALGTSQKLWSLLIRDVAQAGNRLPDILKDDLIRLARWAMDYAIRAIGSDLPLEPLIAVNREMIEGLRPTAPAVREADIAPASGGRLRRGSAPGIEAARAAASGSGPMPLVCSA